MPKVSVVIPVYGVEKYIERCAISLFEQTLDNIEYIFVDDCSPDNSINILKSILAKYEKRIPHTKIVRMPVNSGQAAVRKYGISLTTGEYIIHCDSDDWVELDMYEKLYNTAINGNFDVVICDFFKFHGKGKSIHVTQTVSENKNELIREILNETIHASLCNKLIKRNLYRDIIYPKDNLREDLTLIVQLIYRANRIKYIAEPFYHYFFNESSITNNKDNIEKTIKLAEQAVNNYRILEHFMKENNILDYYQKEMFNMRCRLKRFYMVFLLTNKGYQKWDILFPDINIVNLLYSNLSIIPKIEYIIAKLHLYPLYNRLKKYLLSSV